VRVRQARLQRLPPVPLSTAISAGSCHQVAEQCAMLYPHYATCAVLCCVHLQVSGRVPTSQTTLLPMHDLCRTFSVCGNTRPVWRLSSKYGWHSTSWPKRTQLSTAAVASLLWLLCACSNEALAATASSSDGFLDLAQCRFWLSPPLMVPFVVACCCAVCF
jgi:hypothetical protein